MPASWYALDGLCSRGRFQQRIRRPRFHWYWACHRIPVQSRGPIAELTLVGDPRLPTAPGHSRRSGPSSRRFLLAETAGLLCAASRLVVKQEAELKSSSDSPRMAVG